ncbi:MAG TPA: PAS domain-containing protein [Ramlibacter sp.]|nr:PAS domain-containing protein [Ramlibacter sp.]
MVTTLLHPDRPAARAAREPAPASPDPRAMVDLAAGLGALGAWAWDTSSERIHCTPGAARVIGLPPGMHPTVTELLARFTGEYPSQLRATILQCIHGGTPFDIEAEVQRPGGGRVWVRLICEPEWDAAGRVVRLHGAVQDVTPARRVQQELRESQRALATLIDNLPGMAYRALNRQDWPLAFASDGALALTGYTAAQLMRGQPPYGALIHPEDTDHVWTEVQQALASHRRFQLTYRLCTPAGEKWVWEQGVGVRDIDGAMLLEGFITDITPAKQAQSELKELNRTLEQRVRDRTEQLETAHAELQAFASSIAHDLRAPMTSLAGFARLLEQQLPDAQGRTAHYLHRIADNVTQMSQLTDALLALARVSGVDLEREPVDLGQLADEVLRGLQAQEPHRAAELRVEPGLLVHGDRRLLQQVLAHLLGNAWKFSRTREVTRIAFGATGVPGGERVFHVRDAGVGFDMAHASQLFGAFRRLHGPGQYEGTGIGLALVRKIIQRHGGRVWAEAEAGVGAAFHFTLPG